MMVACREESRKWNLRRGRRLVRGGAEWRRDILALVSYVVASTGTSGMYDL